jgi:hypothetical protein
MPAQFAKVRGQQQHFSGHCRWCFVRREVQMRIEVKHSLNIDFKNAANAQRGKHFTELEADE